MFADEVRRPPSWLRQGEVNLSAEKFFVIGLFLEVALIVLMAVGTGFTFHLVMHDYRGGLQDYLPVGILVAIFYALPGIVKSQYRPTTFVPGDGGYGHLFMTWNFAFFGVAVIGFLTKSTEFQSRGWLILFYVIGLLGLTGIESALAVFRREGIRHGWLTMRRVLLVGKQGEVERFNLDMSQRPSGNKVVATVFMPDGDVSTSNYTQQLDACVKCAVDAARVHNVTDIVVLTNWANAPGATNVAEKLMDTPAAVHLAGLNLVEQFTQLGVEQLGTATTVVLRRRPSRLQSEGIPRLEVPLHENR